MHIELLKSLVDKGLTHKEIANDLGCSPTSVRYWMNKLKLKSKNFQVGENQFYKSTRYQEKYNSSICPDIENIQQGYDSGKAWDEIVERFKISRSTLSRLIKKGMLKSRTSGESSTLRARNNLYKPSEETRHKISESRKKYLARTKKHAWQNKSSAHGSIPCDKAKSLLKELSIPFIEEYQPLRHKGRFFSVDIAFPDKMVMVEINGRQHYESDGSLKPYYQDRHDLIEAEGWKVYEIPYHRAFNVESMTDLFFKIRDGLQVNQFNYSLYVRPVKEKKEKKTQIIHDYPSDENLKLLASKMKLQELSNSLRIPKKALWAHLNSRGIRTFRSAEALPQLTIMESEIWMHPLAKLTKIYKVSRRTIINFCVKNGIKMPPNGHWAKGEKPKSRKVPRPTKEELERLIQEKPFIEIARQFGISDNAVRKWCRCYGLDSKAGPYSHKNKKFKTLTREPAVPA